MPIVNPILFYLLLIPSLFFPLVQIIIRTRACRGGTGCSGLIPKGDEDVMVSMVMKYLDLGDSGSGIRSVHLVSFCRSLTVTSFRSPCIVLQFLPASVAPLNHTSP